MIGEKSKRLVIIGIDALQWMDMPIPETQSRLCPADSTGGRNTLVFLERWSVEDEVSDKDVLHRPAEV